VVELFSKAGFITFEQERELVDTALANGHVRVAQFVSDHLLSQRVMSELGPRERVAKVWQEFNRVDEDNNGHVDIAELRTLAAALGTPLTEPELAEARVALDTDGNGKVDFEEFIAFWLSDEEGIDPAVVTAASEIQARGRLTSDFGEAAPASTAEAAEAADWGAAPAAGAAPGSALVGAEATRSAPESVVGAEEGTGSAVRGIGVVTDYA
jgi:Ca2+-binding EF-hand superfamily protein